MVGRSPHRAFHGRRFGGRVARVRLRSGSEAVLLTCSLPLPHSTQANKLGARAESHKTSPAVWLNGSDVRAVSTTSDWELRHVADRCPLAPPTRCPPQFIGGCDDTLAWIKSNFLAGSPVGRAPRVSHGNDAYVVGDGAEYTYDMVVIGGGSGGLAASKEAAAHGAKVAVRFLRMHHFSICDALHFYHLPTLAALPLTPPNPPPAPPTNSIGS